MWNIKKIIKKGKYLYALVPEHPKATKNGYVLMHRIVIENFIGRTLDKKEEIHHINGNRHDNRIENLQIIEAGEHQRLHATKYPNGHWVFLLCGNCKKIFKRSYHNRPQVHGNKNSYCSLSCRNLAYKKKICPNISTG